MEGKSLTRRGCFGREARHRYALAETSGERGEQYRADQRLYAGTEVVEFSPTEELGRTMEVVTKNMEAAS
jgi:hypothetical protein